jgi:hypothetical protein
VGRFEAKDPLGSYVGVRITVCEAPNPPRD